MNPECDLIFAYLEEDNVQRAYFRARPILTVHGDIREEAEKQWPNDGCLRIVPDKNEQHTFKERMRTLGSWCMLDLTGFQPEANKIRTNKNYRPDKGEVNQFILYSDTVKELPPRVFYEVLDGAPADHAALAEKSITPAFYIRENDTLYGPVIKGQETVPATAGEAAVLMLDVTLPDGCSHTMLCNPAENIVTERPPMAAKPLAPRFAAAAKQPEAESPAAQPAPLPVQRRAPEKQPKSAPEKPAAPEMTDEALPIGKQLNILDQSRTFEETLDDLNQGLSSGANLLHSAPAASAVHDLNKRPAPNLIGTPLTHTPLHTATPQPKNKLQEFVSNQVRVVLRNDPPAEPLPAGAKLRQVENPVQAACEALQNAWHYTDSHPQLVDCILSLEGMNTYLQKHAASALQHGVQQQLQDLEAERLSALVQLDKAKADLESYRKTALENTSAKTKAEIEKLTGEKDALSASVEALKEQLNLLIAQRTELTTRLDELNQGAIPAAIVKLLTDAGMSAPMTGVPLRMNPVSGTTQPVSDVLARIEKTCRDSNVPYDRNGAIAFLVLLASCPRIGMTANVPAAASTLARNLADALGWTGSFAHQTTLEQKPLKAATPAYGTPAILMTSLAQYAPLDGLCKVMLARNAQQLVRNASYDADPWPVYPLPMLSFVPALTCSGSPVSAASLDELLADPAEADVVETALAPLLEHAPILSGTAFNTMVQFARACASVMDGGLPAALDWAILLWFIPAVDRNARTLSLLRPLLAEYPLSAAAL